MHNHEPQNYQCPFCRVVKGIEDEFVYSRQADIFYRDEFLTAFVASHWWPNNRGHVIIVTNEHIENSYDLPDDLSDKIHRLEKKLMRALKETYQCDGVSSRQHNEPCGGQDVWHYHLHIFPRYEKDKLYSLHEEKYLSKAEERVPFAEKLRNCFKR
ncbi:HIT family protein [Patescibacteria group bacterium]|nr:MAG: HIT family protein [Patescibacteria group bacterium]